MRAIILAAGIGSRLRPLTNDAPKTMTSVGGMPIIERQINVLNKKGIEKIYVCVGYKKEMLMNFIKKKFPELDINFVENDDFLTTDNLYTLNLAKNHIEGEQVILINADVAFDEEIIDLCKENEDNSVAFYDSSNFDKKEPQLEIKNNKAYSIILPSMDNSKSSGRTSGIFLLNKDASTKLVEDMYKLMNQKEDSKKWFECSLDNIFKQTDFLPIDLKGIRWAEVDDFEDLEKAKSIFE